MRASTLCLALFEDARKGYNADLVSSVLVEQDPE